MNELTNELNDYFLYIRTIYLNEFSKYMSDITKMKIRELHDVIRLDDELSFKCYIMDKKIYFNLNIEKYLSEDNLDTTDLKQESKNYIEYLKTTDVKNIVKNKFLKQVLLLFMDNSLDVISRGLVDEIEEYLSLKYKLPRERFIKSKERQVAFYIEHIVGKDNLYQAVLNGNEDIIKTNYNLYVQNKDLEDYDTFINQINTTYSNYYKKIGKVYLTDTLYEYDNLDYHVEQKTVNVQDEKQAINNMRIKRLISIKTGIINLLKHRYIFNSLQIVKLESALIEINKIIDKIEDEEDRINDYYGKILDIENDCSSCVDKMWQNVVTNPNNYKMNGEFNFLIGNDDKEIIKATFLSSYHLKQIKASKLTYGFIYEPNGILYASSKDIMYKEIEDENYEVNHDTLYINNRPIEIDNQEDSKLITPSMILRNNLKEKTLQNKIILDGTKTKIIGIYAFIDNELEGPNYDKALLLSEEYGVPVIPINKNNYYKGTEEPKIEVKMEKVKVEPKKSFIDRLKEAIIEENEEEEDIKTL